MFNNGFGNDSKKPSKNHASEPVEKTPQNSFRKLFKQFASDTSFGGISKATLSEGHLRRFIWFLISATCYGFTIYMCLQLIETYLDRPIKTEVDIVYEKVGGIFSWLVRHHPSWMPSNLTHLITISTPKCSP